MKNTLENNEAMPIVATSVEEPAAAAAAVQDIPTPDLENSDRSDEDQVIQLKNPLKFGGRLVKELRVSREAMTAQAATKAERIFFLKMPEWGNDRPPILSMTYWQILGSVVCGVPYEQIEQLPGRVAMELGNKTQMIFFAE